MADNQVEGVLRNTRPLAATVVFGILGLAGLVFAELDRHYGATHFLGIVLAPTMFVLALRSAQSSIKWNRQRVAARGAVAKTRRLAWPQIAGFDYQDGGVLGARLQDGRWVRLMPYPHSGRNDPDQAIARLEAARQTAME